MVLNSREGLSDIVRVVSALAAGTAPETGLRRALEMLCDLVTCAAAGVWRFDAATRTFARVTHVERGYVGGAFDSVVDRALDAAVQGTEPVTVTAEDGYSVACAMPLIWRGAFVGVLVTCYQRTERPLAAGREHDEMALQVIAPLVAATLWRSPESAHPASEHLLHLQAVVRFMLEQPDLDANLREAVRAVQALGWERVILALLDQQGRVEQLFTVGVEMAHDDLHGQSVIPPDAWERLLKGELEPHRRSGLYCVFDDAPDNAHWHEGDLVFARLRVGQGNFAAVLRVDQPVGGLRPLPETLRALDILANQTAYMIENARLLERLSRSAEKLEEQVEELSMMHRADRELSMHLDVERIMRLTMDWALRRTGATTGLVMLMSDDRRGLVPSILMGHIDREIFPYTAHNPLPFEVGVIGRAARTGKTQLVRDVRTDRDYVPFFPGAQSHISVPLSMRGEVLGVITLASDRMDAFGQTDVSFLERLSRRAGVAFDNARLFKQSEQLADDMAVIYTASRTITSTLERDTILQRIAQSMTVALECSSTVIFDYRPETDGVQVLAIYRLGTAHDAPEVLPETGYIMPVSTFPAFQNALEQQRTLVLRASDPSLSQLDRQHMIEDNIHVMVLIPLVAQNELIGLAAVIEGRYDRAFSSNDLFKLETLGGQAAIALRQSMLYSEVLELEKLKSEMIRMASHDLRNPLNNIMGYVELLWMTLDQIGATSDQMMYVENLRRSARTMQTLLEDLLTLERIESDRQSNWTVFDLSGLVREVVDELGSSAGLKQQALNFDWPDGLPSMYGSVTQMRQAVSNLVGNAIKYTPEHGTVTVSLHAANGRLNFKVVDNGHGISPERQKKLFQRFYRAQEPGTEHIGGTGLGLSLVKTVIERHGGAVWFESAPGQGSTFGFWVPAEDDVSDRLGGAAVR